MRHQALRAFSQMCAFHRSAFLAPSTVIRFHEGTQPQLIRLFAAQTEAEMDLHQRARDFVDHKNAVGCGEGTLEAVFDMCSPDAELYGLAGEDVYRSGLTDFFAKFEGLNHELLAEPTKVGPATVQYPFTKSWRNEDGEVQSWSSIDPKKPRNKVERLDFSDSGMLERVAVVDASAPLAPLSQPVDTPPTDEDAKQ